MRQELRELCDQALKVRMAAGVDSLNVPRSESYRVLVFGEEVVTSAGVLLHGCVERERA